MDYWRHTTACFGVAITSSIIGLYTGKLNLLELRYFWIGVLPYSLIITCDLDSEESIVRKLWGPFKIIWHPFVTAGHREILHNPVWSPFILISFLWVPLTGYGVDVSRMSIIGAILMLWTHIATDIVYSGYRELVPNWLEKKIKKVF